MSELFPTKTIALEYLHCTDASREYEFNHWCNRVYLPNNLSTPGVVNIYRYRNVAKELRDGQARYLNIYRIISCDPLSVALAIKGKSRQLGVNAQIPEYYRFYFLTAWDFLTYRHTVANPQPYKQLPDGMPEAMLVVPSICTDLNREADFNEWYLYTHHHDLLETPGLVQTHRYVNVDPNYTQEEGKYLALYEIDAEDPAEVVRKILEDDRNVRIPQGRMINCIRATYGFGTYQHIDI